MEDITKEMQCIICKAKYAKIFFDASVETSKEHYKDLLQASLGLKELIFALFVSDPNTEPDGLKSAVDPSPSTNASQQASNNSTNSEDACTSSSVQSQFITTELCKKCGVVLADIDNHIKLCHKESKTVDRQYVCFFCDNVYSSCKSCLIHLKRIHRLYYSNDFTQAVVKQQNNRVTCKTCLKTFVKKQVLQRHLWNAHGIQINKKKASTCPLCNGLVTYGQSFSKHLKNVHALEEEVKTIILKNMNEFQAFKKSTQDETKTRFRKISASRQLLQGVRSNYMCSQSGVYVYQGKHKRPTPGRQIYKTGKACPARMIVTEYKDHVETVFHSTHVGHGICPYFETREKRQSKRQQSKAKVIAATTTSACDDEYYEEEDYEEDKLPSSCLCEVCGGTVVGYEHFKNHMISHDKDDMELYASEVMGSEFTL